MIMKGIKSLWMNKTKGVFLISSLNENEIFERFKTTFHLMQVRPDLSAKENEFLVMPDYSIRSIIRRISADETPCWWMRRHFFQSMALPYIESWTLNVVSNMSCTVYDDDFGTFGPCEGIYLSCTRCVGDFSSPTETVFYRPKTLNLVMQTCLAHKGPRR